MIAVYLLLTAALAGWLLLKRRLKVDPAWPELSRGNRFRRFRKTTIPLFTARQ